MAVTAGSTGWPIRLAAVHMAMMSYANRTTFFMAGHRQLLRMANTHSQWPRMYSGSLGWLMPTGFPAAWKHGVGNCVPMQLVALIRECLTILHRLPSPKSGSDFAKAIGRAGETAKNR